MTYPPTPGQTIGPFFGFALAFDGDADLVPPGHPAAVRLHGRVLDGAGEPVPDALVELWQARTDGAIPRSPGSLRRDGFGFTGFGRSATDQEGRYAFSTLVPGASGEGRAPFFLLTVFARGLLDRLFTRAYLPGPDERFHRDPLLASVSADRRDTLIARLDDHGFEFDIRLQGADETVFVEYTTD